MRETIEVTAHYNGYQTHALPYYQGHSAELRVLVAWEANGEDLDFTVEFAFLEEVTVLVAIHGLGRHPELLPQSYAVAKEIRGQSAQGHLLRWLGDNNALREQWATRRRENTRREYQVNQALRAAI